MVVSGPFHCKEALFNEEAKPKLLIEDKNVMRLTILWQFLKKVTSQNDFTFHFNRFHLI